MNKKDASKIDTLLTEIRDLQEAYNTVMSNLSKRYGIPLILETFDRCHDWERGLLAAFQITQRPPPKQPVEVGYDGFFDGTDFIGPQRGHRGHTSRKGKQ